MVILCSKNRNIKVHFCGRYLEEESLKILASKWNSHSSCIYLSCICLIPAINEFEGTIIKSRNNFNINKFSYNHNNILNTNNQKGFENLFKSNIFDIQIGSLKKISKYSVGIYIYLTIVKFLCLNFSMKLFLIAQI